MPSAESACGLAWRSSSAASAPISATACSRSCHDRLKRHRTCTQKRSPAAGRSHYRPTPTADADGNRSLAEGASLGCARGENHSLVVVAIDATGAGKDDQNEKSDNYIYQLSLSTPKSRHYQTIT